MNDGAPASVASVRYYSSRDRAREAPASFEEALLAGLAPDGGLYLPERLPQAPATWREARDPAALAGTLLAELTGSRPQELTEALRPALDFPLPVIELTPGTYVLELFHGPTAAFKDVGARVMARLMDRALERLGRTATVLVATSGDTGSAVADAFAGSSHIEVALLFPDGKVSAVQEQQLVARRQGVRSFAVAGTFDDCQRMVKGAFTDPELVELGLSTANSINVGRLLPQLVYYFWAAGIVARDFAAAEPLEVVVPSGNLGNLTAGVMASAMGLEVAGFTAAHNANDYFPRFLDGRAEPYAFEASVPTLSNAMDVGAPSNFERLYALYGDSLSGRLAAVAVDDETTLRRMAATYEEHGYLVCPHTAVGLEALAQRRAASDDRSPALVLATAHPAKFPEAVREATGEAPPHHPGLEAIMAAERSVEALEPTQEALRAALLRHRAPS